MGARQGGGGWYFRGERFAKDFGRGGPAARNHCVCDRFPHQGNRLAEKKDLDLVTSFRKCIAVKERERGLCWVIRAPGTFHEDFEFYWTCRGRDSGRRCEKREDWKLS